MRHTRELIVGAEIACGSPRELVPDMGIQTEEGQPEPLALGFQDPDSPHIVIVILDREEGLPNFVRLLAAQLDADGKRELAASLSGGIVLPNGHGELTRRRPL